ncbi:SLAP domain-containing protein [Lactobacillus sp. LL6]|uniref:SLAP domain-containing protein n=1 Tax=Lactobacillus sp. LL6 TaxID=2596827 RepID=UPI0011852857|nr:SLAP domain-containing protein [Lactobacillus sp. LL6]TSO25762.1 hypothetical protein FOD82_01405 [Lactobacillus sp. LL6]
MKNKIKIIGIAAATLLTVAPVVTPVALKSPSKALAATYVSEADRTSYFTYNGQRYAGQFNNGNGVEIYTGKITLQALLDKAKALAPFHPGNKDQKMTTTTSELYNQLTSLGISVTKNDSQGEVTIPNKDFNVTLEGTDPIEKLGKSSISIPFHPIERTDSPLISVHYTQNGVEVNNVVQDQTFEVAPNSKFAPTNFVSSDGTRYTFTASESSDNNTSVKVSGDGNEVDTSKSNSHYKVTLSATNRQGKTTKATYTVVVKPEGKYRVYGDNATYIHYYSYNKSNNNMLPAGATISNGTELYIGSKSMILNGTSYIQFSQKSQADVDKSSYYIEMKYLTLNQKVPKVVTKTIMHKALVYDAGGGSKFRKLAAYTKVQVNEEPVIIRGEKYYKVADRPDYLKASNIDGTERTLKHNAYIYATSTRRADRKVLKKGTKITTYGGSYKFKNGKRYYRVEGATKTNKRYVKVANFE